MREQSAEKALAVIEKLGEQLIREGVGDIIDVFNELLNILALPGSGPESERMEHRLGQMSELLTQFHHSIRRATPRELYTNLSGDDADEAEEDSALRGEPGETKKRVLGATLGAIYLSRLRAFLKHFAGRAAEETPDTSTNPEGVVQIMTVHQAKGLEFPVAFVPSLVEGRFPSRMMG